MTLPSADVFPIMTMKALARLFLGVLPEIIRHQRGSVCLTMRIRAATNAFGS